MSKKLLNDPKNAVVEMLEGLVDTTPHLCLLDGLPDIKVVVDANRDPSKVSLISGGGSGHEPAHAGYVGRGMLTAAVCGDVFASPSTEAVLSAIRSVTGPAGGLLIVKNYTGDRLNFGLAAEQAKNEGFKVEMVVVGEDCALADKTVAGRRGLAGTVFVHKVAGAVAEQGADLETVTRVAKKVSESIGTMGVALTVCTLPGSQPSDRLGETEIELGLGIHGEPGAEKVSVQSADAIVRKMLDIIVRSESKYLPLEPKTPVALMVNNLGATPGMELSVVARSAVQYLALEFGVEVDHVYVGSFMTSLDMAGMSLTLLKLDPEIAPLLEAPNTVPAWPKASAKRPANKPKVPVPAPKTADALTTGRPSELTPQARRIEAAILSAADALVSHEPELTDWDTRVGDGDCGTTLRRGAEAVKEDLSQNYPLNDPVATARHLAESVNRSMGGSSGALYNIFFTASASALQSAQDVANLTVKDWRDAFESGVCAIQKYGGASKGYRTMLDAMLPALDALEASVSGQDVMDAVCEAAKNGADATCDMPALAGRASYVPADILKSVPDPGAKAVEFWLEGIKHGSK